MNTNVTQLPQTGTVPENGQELYYEIHGDGPPLVLVMGIGTTARSGRWHRSPQCPHSSR